MKADTRFIIPGSRPEIYESLVSEGWLWSKENHGQIAHPTKEIWGLWKNMWGGFKLCYTTQGGNHVDEWDDGLYEFPGTDDYEKVKAKLGLCVDRTQEQIEQIRNEFEPII